MSSGRNAFARVPDRFFSLSIINRHIFDIILHIIDIIQYMDGDCERKRAARISRPPIVIKRLLLRII